MFAFKTINVIPNSTVNYTNQTIGQLPNNKQRHCIEQQTNRRPQFLFGLATIGLTWAQILSAIVTLDTSRKESRFSCLVPDQRPALLYQFILNLQVEFHSAYARLLFTLIMVSVCFLKNCSLTQTIFHNINLTFAVQNFLSLSLLLVINNILQTV